MADLQLSKEEQGNRARIAIKEYEDELEKLQTLLKAKTKDYDYADHTLKNLKNEFEFLKREKEGI